MIRGAEQEAGSGTILAPGDRVLVVTAGRGDRGDVAVRLLEHLGASCVLLDVSSAGSDPDRLRTDVRDAYGSSPDRAAWRWPASASGPARSSRAATALDEHASLPCVLIVNGRFDGGDATLRSTRRAVAAAARPRLPAARARRARAVARELGECSELVVVRTLAEDGDEALSSWRSSTPPRSPGPGGSTRRGRPGPGGQRRPPRSFRPPEVSTPEPVPAPPRLRAVATPRSRTAPPDRLATDARGPRSDRVRRTMSALGGTITLGDLEVHRLGFGAMRVTGKGVWGRPPIATPRSPCCGAPSSSAWTSSTRPTATGRASASSSSPRRCTRTPTGS